MEYSKTGIWTIPQDTNSQILVPSNVVQTSSRFTQSKNYSTLSDKTSLKTLQNSRKNRGDRKKPPTVWDVADRLKKTTRSGERNLFSKSTRLKRTRLALSHALPKSERKRAQTEGVPLGRVVFCPRRKRARRQLKSGERVIWRIERERREREKKNRFLFTIYAWLGFWCGKVGGAEVVELFWQVLSVMWSLERVLGKLV